MKEQSFYLKQNNFGNGYFKVTPRKLLMMSKKCRYKEDKEKLENLSSDLQKKYGVEDFMLKFSGNKVVIKSLNDNNEFGGVF